MSGWLLLLDLIGFIAIGLIVWWFWLYKPRAMKGAAGQSIDIVVDQGVYTPSRIEVPAGEPVSLRFLRKDPGPCAEKVIFDGLAITQDLELNKKTTVKIPPQRPGEFAFTCQMQMYRGSLIVTK